MYVGNALFFVAFGIHLGSLCNVERAKKRLKRSRFPRRDNGSERCGEGLFRVDATNVIFVRGKTRERRENAFPVRDVEQSLQEQ